MAKSSSFGQHEPLRSTVDVQVDDVADESEEDEEAAAERLREERRKRR